MDNLQDIISELDGIVANYEQARETMNAFSENERYVSGGTTDAYKEVQNEVIKWENEASGLWSRCLDTWSERNKEHEGEPESQEQLRLDIIKFQNLVHKNFAFPDSILKGGGVG